MKRFSALLLALCLMLCGVAFADEVVKDADFEAAYGEFMEEDAGVELTFDTYHPDGTVMLHYEEEDFFEEGVFVEGETMGITVYADLLPTVGDVFAASGYRNLTVSCETGEFEGWMIFEYVAVLDEYGFEDWQYVMVSESGVYLTTEEVMAMPMPETGIMFVAKVSDVAEEDYFAPVEVDMTDVEWGNYYTFVFDANGGEIVMTESREWSTNFTEYWVPEGSTVVDEMTEEVADGVVYFSPEKEGAEFLGWNVYSGDDLQYSDGSNMEGSDAQFFRIVDPYDPEYVSYVMLTNCETYGENVPTEELWSIVLEGRSYYAVAQWSE